MSKENSPVLSVQDLGLRRSERWLFRGLSFRLKAGEVVKIIGRNGAGKTSLLRALCDFLDHAEGTIDWCEVNEEPCIPLFIGHHTAVKPELSVYENLKFHPIGRQFVTEQAIEQAIDKVRLGDYFYTPARHLSAGQTRRVGLARLLMANTLCWILDEPFTSLDVEGCQWLESEIEKFTANGGCVLLTSHQPVNLNTKLTTLDLNDTKYAISDVLEDEDEACF